MKQIIICILLLAFATTSFCQQEEKIPKTRFVFGVSVPELLHAGVTYRLANVSQVGLNVGLGPSFGGVWPTVSLEHRLYIGKNDERINQKTWFFRQGATYFPSAEHSEQFALDLTLGKDLIFKNHKNGISIDGGLLYLSGAQKFNSQKLIHLWPALRFQFYVAL